MRSFGVLINKWMHIQLSNTALCIVVQDGFCAEQLIMEIFVIQALIFIFFLIFFLVITLFFSIFFLVITIFFSIFFFFCIPIFLFSSSSLVSSNFPLFFFSSSSSPFSFSFFYAALSHAFLTYLNFLFISH